MAKKTRKKKDAQVEVKPPMWPATLLGCVFFLVQVVFLPGAASAFRLPKEALAVAGIAIVGALVLVAAMRRGHLSIPTGPVPIVLAGLPVLHLVSVAWSVDSHAALMSAVVSAAWVLAAVWLAAMTPSERWRVVDFTAIGAAISALVLIAQAAGVPLLVVGRSATSRFRMSGLAGNPADFATAAVLVLPLLLVAVQRKRGSRWRWAAIVILVVATGLSQTLTGYLALAGVGLVWLFQQRSLKLWGAAGAIGVLVVAAALAAGFGDRVRRQVRLIELGDWYSVTSARGDGWTAAAEMIRERPITGVGARHFTHFFYPSRLAWLERRGETGRRGETATHFEWAHCDPLQAVAEFGVLGVTWMAAFVWLLLRVRPRGDPLVPLAAAACAPFLLLHYPTHLAVGMAPIVLILGHCFADTPRTSVPKIGGPARAVITITVVVLAGALTIGQLKRVAVDVWKAHLERAVAAAAELPEPNRQAQLASAVERQILERIDGLPAAAPELWRVVGKARLARRDGPGAEEAFRKSYELWPHEEADFGLGLALAAQNRRGEAMVHLGRVCRANPALARKISDPDLRQTLEDLNRARRRAVKSR